MLKLIKRLNSYCYIRHKLNYINWTRTNISDFINLKRLIAYCVLIITLKTSLLVSRMYERDTSILITSVKRNAKVSSPNRHSRRYKITIKCGYTLLIFMDRSSRKNNVFVFYAQFYTFIMF